MTLDHLLIPSLAAAFLISLSASARAADDSTVRVYIGTYTSAKSKGIYQLSLDLNTGKLTKVGLAAETVNPTFLAFHPSRKFIYAAGEIGQFEGKPTGMVTAFAIDPASGTLTMLNQQPSTGRGPCHVSVDPTGKFALVANYSGGSVTALPIAPDGSLKPATASVQHQGSGPNAKRQEKPHAHSINPDPSGRFALAADLGIDKIVIYQLDLAKGTLEPIDPPFAAVAPGAGPRHLAFHPDGKFAYVINELANTITAFAWDGQRGKLKEIQTVNTLPADFSGSSTTAEVVVHPSGKFVYGSNRGHDSIAAFACDAATGKLTPIGHYPTQGKSPRNFAIDPTGRYLLAANQNTDNIAVYRIDPASGKMELVDTLADVPAPVCVRFWRP